MYEQYEQKKFCIDGHEGILISPLQSCKGNPYIWRTEFLGEFDSVDRELLRRGWHLVYYRVSDQFGCMECVKKMRRFQNYLEEKFSLCKKAVLFGFSRGGLYAVNYAATYPEKVRKLYLDAPVLDIFSWPGGYGRGKGSRKDWALCREIYGIKPGERNTADNPINKIPTLIRNRIPVILVVGAEDTVVPFSENGKLLYADYMQAEAEVKLIVKPRVGHHPHSLENPDEIADWIAFNWDYGCLIESSV